MNTKQVIQAMIIIILLASFASMVSALGIMPSGRVYEYEEGRVISLPITVITQPSSQESKIYLELSGVLAEYALLKDSELVVRAGSTQANTTLTLIIPKLNEPGLAELLLTASEQDPVEASQRIGAALSVTSRFRVRVPYPDAYLETALLMREHNDSVRIIVSKSNRGTKDLSDVFSDIILTNPQGTVITNITTPPVSVQVAENTKQELTFYPPRQGLYVARSHSYYEGGLVSQYEQFMFQESKKLFVEEVIMTRQEGLVQTQVVVKNDWNTALEDVYAEVIIENEEGIAARIRSAYAEFDLGEEKVLSGFEQVTVEEGVYDFVIVMYHHKLLSTATKTLIVEQNRIYFLGEEEPRRSYAVLIYICLVLIITGLAVWIARKKKNT